MISCHGSHLGKHGTRLDMDPVAVYSNRRIRVADLDDGRLKRRIGEQDIASVSEYQKILPGFLKIAGKQAEFLLRGGYIKIRCFASDTEGGFLRKGDLLFVRNLIDACHVDILLQKT